MGIYVFDARFLVEELRRNVADLRRVSLDKAVETRPEARVGLDAEDDRRPEFVVSEGGVTCVPKGSVVGND
jgi:ADP-glucose pyrophosphorylase